MAYAVVSKTTRGDPVRVRIPPSASLRYGSRAASRLAALLLYCPDRERLCELFRMRGPEEPANEYPQWVRLLHDVGVMAQR